MGTGMRQIEQQLTRSHLPLVAAVQAAAESRMPKEAPPEVARALAFGEASLGGRGLLEASAVTVESSRPLQASMVSEAPRKGLGAARRVLPSVRK